MLNHDYTILIILNHKYRVKFSENQAYMKIVRTNFTNKDVTFQRKGVTIG